MTERQPSDIDVQRVTRLPGAGRIVDTILACDACGRVPTGDDENGGELVLLMARVPDRERPLFLGPACLNGEITRYLSERPS